MDEIKMLIGEDLDKIAEIYGCFQRREKDDGLPDPLTGVLVESDDDFRKRIIKRIMWRDDETPPSAAE